MDKQTDRRSFGDALYDALVERQTIAPLTEQAPDITIDDAYKVSLQDARAPARPRARWWSARRSASPARR